MLIGPTTVRIEPVSTAASELDAIRGEAMSDGYGTAFTILAQLNYDRQEDRRRKSRSGADPETVAEITVMRRDVDAASWTPTAGDHVLDSTDRSGRVDRVNLYVAAGVHSGAWPGGHSLWVIPLTDRHPNRKQRNA